VVQLFSYTTNVFKFDTDAGSVTTDLFWDDVPVPLRSAQER
jgi:hypothetical protein